MKKNVTLACIGAVLLSTVGYFGAVGYVFNERVEASLETIDVVLSNGRPDVRAAFAELDVCLESGHEAKRNGIAVEGCDAAVAGRRAAKAELMDLFAKRDQAIVLARSSTYRPWPFQ